MSTQPQTIQLELLLNRRIRDMGGKIVGHIEEVIGEREGEKMFVREYHTGGMGFLEHLSAITIGGWLMKALRKHPGYVIRWDQLDISDPERPRLTCPRSELQVRQ